MERNHLLALPDAVRRLDERVGVWAGSRGRLAVAAHEFVCFGAKQASACLFGGCMVLLLGLTWAFYPAGAGLARYDFLTLAALAIQCVLLATRLETLEEAKVILLFHAVGTAMEVFKTAMGSWIYPGPSLLHIGGVPLFTGFMYGSIGSYIARAWRLFDFRFTHHPPLAATIWLAVAIYVNFFTHHFLPDIRWLLFAAVALLFGRTWVRFRIRQVHRRMPLLLGFGLVATFIWLAENIGTFTAAWRYPAQRHGWTVVPLSKLGAWFLLMIISYVMVSAVAGRSGGKRQSSAGDAERCRGRDF
ncbi:DUF817 domain-containing protein [Dyella mobilis]|uniref:DUF817 domain-containing protein n=1 Tax=Dyella mobilis TaxID=1849582 RepID=A0ABS2KGN6_9GAMM|nr:DUF817 domain-containing protein [Dyella mobilis]MBM7130311.1 DUF817 domain-containing protein [Dyella mobilis]GLQ96937.1 hypothetical protein GCM10007863_13570 [Dyella mobilis]